MPLTVFKADEYNVWEAEECLLPIVNLRRTIFLFTWKENTMPQTSLTVFFSAP